MIWLIRNILLALSSETHPAQIAFGAAIGIALGLCPMDNMIWFALLFSIFVFRVNIGMSIVFFTFGKLIGISSGQIRESLGSSLLNSESLYSLFNSIYNVPVLGISGFNKPIVMGALILTLLLSILIVPCLIYLTNIYRTKIQPKLEKIWIIKVLKGSKLYQIYTKIVG